MSTVNFNDTVPAPPANFTNLKWQSDASGNISAYDPGGTWQTWTPAFPVYGGMTTTPTTLAANYLRIGPLVYVTIRMLGTTSGTANGTIQITNLPIVPLSVTNLHYALTAAVTGPSTVFTPAFAYASGTDGFIYSYFANGAVWPLGSISLIINGVYRCA